MTENFRFVVGFEDAQDNSRIPTLSSSRAQETRRIPLSKLENQALKINHGNIVTLGASSSAPLLHRGSENDYQGFQKDIGPKEKKVSSWSTSSALSLPKNSQLQDAQLLYDPSSSPFSHHIMNPHRDTHLHTQHTLSRIDQLYLDHRRREAQREKKSFEAQKLREEQELKEVTGRPTINPPYYRRSNSHPYYHHEKQQQQVGLNNNQPKNRTAAEKCTPSDPSLPVAGEGALRTELDGEYKYSQGFVREEPQQEEEEKERDQKFKKSIFLISPLPYSPPPPPPRAQTQTDRNMTQSPPRVSHSSNAVNNAISAPSSGSSYEAQRQSIFDRLSALTEANKRRREEMAKRAKDSEQRPSIQTPKSGVNKHNTDNTNRVDSVRTLTKISGTEDKHAKSRSSSALSSVASDAPPTALVSDRLFQQARRKQIRENQVQNHKNSIEMVHAEEKRLRIQLEYEAAKKDILLAAAASAFSSSPNLSATSFPTSHGATNGHQDGRRQSPLRTSSKPRFNDASNTVTSSHSLARTAADYPSLEEKEEDFLDCLSPLTATDAASRYDRGESAAPRSDDGRSGANGVLSKLHDYSFLESERSQPSFGHYSGSLSRQQNLSSHREETSITAISSNLIDDFYSPKRIHHLERDGKPLKLRSRSRIELERELQVIEVVDEKSHSSLLMSSRYGDVPFTSKKQEEHQMYSRATKDSFYSSTFSPPQLAQGGAISLADGSATVVDITASPSPSHQQALRYPANLSRVATLVTNRSDHPLHQRQGQGYANQFLKRSLSPPPRDGQHMNPHHQVQHVHHFYYPNEVSTVSPPQTQHSIKSNADLHEDDNEEEEEFERDMLFSQDVDTSSPLRAKQRVFLAHQNNPAYQPFLSELERRVQQQQRHYGDEHSPPPIALPQSRGQKLFGSYLASDRKLLGKFKSAHVAAHYDPSTLRVSEEDSPSPNRRVDLAHADSATTEGNDVMFSSPQEMSRSMPPSPQKLAETIRPTSLSSTAVTTERASLSSSNTNSLVDSHLHSSRSLSSSPTGPRGQYNEKGKENEQKIKMSAHPQLSPRQQQGHSLYFASSSPHQNPPLSIDNSLLVERTKSQQNEEEEILKSDQLTEIERDKRTTALIKGANETRPKEETIRWNTVVSDNNRNPKALNTPKQMTDPASSRGDHASSRMIPIISSRANKAFKLCLAETSTVYFGKETRGESKDRTRSTSYSSTAMTRKPSCRSTSVGALLSNFISQTEPLKRKIELMATQIKRRSKSANARIITTAFNTVADSSSKSATTEVMKTFKNNKIKNTSSSVRRSASRPITNSISPNKEASGDALVDLQPSFHVPYASSTKQMIERGTSPLIINNSLPPTSSSVDRDTGSNTTINPDPAHKKMFVDRESSPIVFLNASSTLAPISAETAFFSEIAHDNERKKEKDALLILAGDTMNNVAAIGGQSSRFDHPSETHSPDLCSPEDRKGTSSVRWVEASPSPPPRQTSGLKLHGESDKILSSDGNQQNCDNTANADMILSNTQRRPFSSENNPENGLVVAEGVPETIGSPFFVAPTFASSHSPFQHSSSYSSVSAYDTLATSSCPMANVTQSSDGESPLAFADQISHTKWILNKMAFVSAKEKRGLLEEQQEVMTTTKQNSEQDHPLDVSLSNQSLQAHSNLLSSRFSVSPAPARTLTYSVSAPRGGDGGDYDNLDRLPLDDHATALGGEHEHEHQREVATEEEEVIVGSHSISSHAVKSSNDYHLNYIVDEEETRQREQVLTKMVKCFPSRSVSSTASSRLPRYGYGDSLLSPETPRNAFRSRPQQETMSTTVVTYAEADSTQVNRDNGDDHHSTEKSDEDDHDDDDDDAFHVVHSPSLGTTAKMIEENRDDACLSYARAGLNSCSLSPLTALLVSTSSGGDETDSPSPRSYVHHTHFREEKKSNSERTFSAATGAHSTNLAARVSSSHNNAEEFIYQNATLFNKNSSSMTASSPRSVLRTSASVTSSDPISVSAPSSSYLSSTSFFSPSSTSVAAPPKYSESSSPSPDSLASITSWRKKITESFSSKKSSSVETCTTNSDERSLYSCRSSSSAFQNPSSMITMTPSKLFQPPTAQSTTDISNGTIQVHKKIEVTPDSIAGKEASPRISLVTRSKWNNSLPAKSGEENDLDNMYLSIDFVPSQSTNDKERNPSEEKGAREIESLSGVRVVEASKNADLVNPLRKCSSRLSSKHNQKGISSEEMEKVSPPSFSATDDDDLENCTFEPRTNVLKNKTTFSHVTARYLSTTSSESCSRTLTQQQRQLVQSHRNFTTTNVHFGASLSRGPANDDNDDAEDRRGSSLSTAVARDSRSPSVDSPDVGRMVVMSEAFLDEEQYFGKSESATSSEVPLLMCTRSFDRCESVTRVESSTIKNVEPSADATFGGRMIKLTSHSSSDCLQNDSFPQNATNLSPKPPLPINKKRNDVLTFTTCNMDYDLPE